MHRTALFFQKGNFIGREYFHALSRVGRRADLLIAVGEFSAESRQRELDRTAGRWSPPPIPPDEKIFYFAKANDPDLLALLVEREIDISILGGAGIIGRKLLTAPSIGFLNIHPGRLPQYQGHNCPEWALLEKEPVMATAHIVDEGVDTGPIVCDAE